MVDIRKVHMKMNSEIKRVVTRVKSAQENLKVMLQRQDWVEEARKYADRQRKEMKKLLASDLEKVKTFVEKERKELEKFQKELPGEVKKVKALLKGQRKDLSKLLATIKKSGLKAATAKTVKSKPRKATSKAAGTRRKKAAAATSANA
jgi:hypothetical protein